VLEIPDEESLPGHHHDRKRRLKTGVFFVGATRAGWRTWDFLRSRFADVQLTNRFRALGRSIESGGR
jgi:hypothetical protein